MPEPLRAGNRRRPPDADWRGQIVLSGDVSSPLKPRGCHFHTRCPYAMGRCREVTPALRELQPGDFASCHLHDDGVRAPLARLAAAAA